MLLFIYQVMQC